VHHLHLPGQPLQVRHADGKVERWFGTGERTVVFSNGTQKHYAADGVGATVLFVNGDVKRTFADGRVEYYYAQVDTWHSTHADGTQVRVSPTSPPPRLTPPVERERPLIGFKRGCLGRSKKGVSGADMHHCLVLHLTLPLWIACILMVARAWRDNVRAVHRVALHWRGAAV